MHCDASKWGWLISKHHNAFQWDLSDALPDDAAAADTRCGHPLMNPRPLINLCFQVKHSPFLANLACATQEIFKLLFIHHLIFELWLESIKYDYIRKELKVSVLQANAKLVKKGERNQRFIRGPGSIPIGSNILLLKFLFSCSYLPSGLKFCFRY